MRHRQELPLLSRSAQPIRTAVGAEPSAAPGSRDAVPPARPLRETDFDLARFWTRHWVGRASHRAFHLYTVPGAHETRDPHERVRARGFPSVSGATASRHRHTAQPWAAGAACAWPACGARLFLGAYLSTRSIRLQCACKQVFVLEGHSTTSPMHRQTQRGVIFLLDYLSETMEHIRSPLANLCHGRT